MSAWRAVCVAVVLSLNSQDVSAQNNVCGIVHLNGRIMGGQTAKEGAWPWQVSIRDYGYKHFCGGTLINKDWVLTAAHCFVSTSTNGFIVELGWHYEEISNANRLQKNINKIIKHPNYIPALHENDIALLRLSSSVTFTNYIRPVCLAAADSIFNAGTKTWITGWGSFSPSCNVLPYPGALQEVEIPVMEQKKCKDSYYPLAAITNNMMCAGIEQGGKDSCKGDDGGPMVVKQGSVWVQAGIVSFGIGCGESKYPAVYTRVSQFQSWINNVIVSNLPGYVTVVTAGGCRNGPRGNVTVVNTGGCSNGPPGNVTIVITEGASTGGGCSAALTAGAGSVGGTPSLLTGLLTLSLYLLILA